MIDVKKAWPLLRAKAVICLGIALVIIALLTGNTWLIHTVQPRIAYASSGMIAFTLAMLIVEIIGVSFTVNAWDAYMRRSARKH